MSDQAVAGVHTDQCVCHDCREEWADLADWGAYRKCPICRRETGQPCVALSGAVAGGQPDGNLTPLEVPHAARKKRRGR